MKNAILIFILCILCITIQAQEKIKQTEMGFTFRNLDNFGLCLKKGSNKFMWRFNTVILSSSKNKENNDTITNTSGGFGFSIGHQFVKQLRDNFEFYTGYDFEYSHSKMKTVTKISLHDQPYEKSTTNLYGINII